MSKDMDWKKVIKSLEDSAKAHADAQLWSPNASQHGTAARILRAVAAALRIGLK